MELQLAPADAADIQQVVYEPDQSLQLALHQGPGPLNHLRVVARQANDVNGTTEQGQRVRAARARPAGRGIHPAGGAPRAAAQLPALSLVGQSAVVGGALQFDECGGSLRRKSSTNTATL